MTVSQFVDYVRNRHNAGSDSNWSDLEIYQMITARANELLSLIGAVEDTNTSQSTVAGTQAYTLPTGTVALKALLWNGIMLQQISFREWEQQKAAGSTADGDPEKYVVWDNQVLLIPIPTSVQTLTFYIESMQTYIDDATDTIVVPEELHFRLADGVIADMFAKDLNFNGARMYEDKWINVHMPAFYEWVARKRRRGKFQLTIDSDNAVGTDIGSI